MLKQLAEDIKGLSVKGSLNESFSEKNLEKVSNLIAQIFSKGKEGKFKPFKSEGWYNQTFTSKDGTKGIGFGFVSTEGYMLRLGYVKKRVKSVNKNFKYTYAINNIAFWKPDGQAKFNKPSISVQLKPWINVVESVQVLKDIFSGKITENKIDEATAMASKKLVDYAHFKGFDEVTTDWAYHKVKKTMGDSFDQEEFKGYTITRNVEETNSIEETFTVNDKKLKEQKYADENVVFDDLESLTKVVGLGLQNSLLVVGSAGIGKTFHVTKVLEDMKGSPKGPQATWKHFKGLKSSPFGLFKILFQYAHGYTIVFDDSDSVLGDKDCINMLKSALKK
jgi:hypothetical protein